jgi:hypothetical protein
LFIDEAAARANGAGNGHEAAPANATTERAPGTRKRRSKPAARENKPGEGSPDTR